MPLHAFGDGMRKAVVTAGLAFEVARREADGGPKPGGLLLLDEAEVALHVSSQKDFFSALIGLCRKLEVQLFLTTHSLETVDAILQACEGKDEDLAAYRLAKKGPRTSITSYPGAFLRETRYEMGFEIR